MSARIALGLVLTVAAPTGCGGEDEGAIGAPGGTGGAAGECAPPNRLVGDACREPGVQDDGCPAGTLGLGEGTCRPAGIPPEMCGEGFVHDGDVGCEPILPAEPCPPGQMAVPGETRCRPVMPCAPGKWGDIAVDATTEHVDGSYAGADSDGSPAKPWTTISDAIAAAAPGATVAVAAGGYAEDVIIQGKPVVLWGVCPDDVEIVGTGAVPGAIIVVNELASGAVVRGLAVKGAANGIVISGADSVLLDSVWVHDNAGWGIEAQDSRGAASCTIRASLVDGNHGLGVVVSGSEAIIEATVVRGGLPGTGLPGRGVHVQESPDGAPSKATVYRSLIEQNRDKGVVVIGSEASIGATVVRETLFNAQAPSAEGVSITESPATGAPAKVTVQGSLVESSHGLGVAVVGAEATIEATVVRGTVPDVLGELGHGVTLRETPGGGARSIAALISSTVDQNQGIGVFVSGSDATIEATVVRRTLPDAKGLGGRGIGIQPDLETGAPSKALVRGSLVEQSKDIGVLVATSEVTIEATVVRATSPDAQGLGGRGIEIQNTSGVPTFVRSSVVEQNHELGVVAFSADVTIESCVLAATLANVDMRFGDGVLAVADEGPATVWVSATRIADSARAGISNFGAFVSLGGSVVQCAAFDLEGESIYGAPFTFENRGGNSCGCPTADGECLLETVGIEPPTPANPIE